MEILLSGIYPLLLVKLFPRQRNHCGLQIKLNILLVVLLQNLMYFIVFILSMKFLTIVIMLNIMYLKVLQMFHFQKFLIIMLLFPVVQLPIRPFMLFILAKTIIFMIFFGTKWLHRGILNKLFKCVRNTKKKFKNTKKKILEFSLIFPWHLYIILSFICNLFIYIYSFSVLFYFISIFYLFIYIF